MSYVKGDRVRMRSNPAQVGTVTGERDQMFLSFVGVQWRSGDFGFVAPSNLEWVGAVAIPGMSEPDRYALNMAYRLGLDVASKPSPDGKVLTDWKTRAERAEAEIMRIRDLREGDLCSHCLSEVQDALDADQ